MKVTLTDPKPITTENPSSNIILRVNSMKRSKFEPVKVDAEGVALEKTLDY